jgi:mono/diheme cytochrome c family protein
MTMNLRGLILISIAVSVTACDRSAPVLEAPAAEPPKVFTPRPLRDIVVARTPERIQRGRYLSEGLLQCFVCHSERDWKKPGAPPIPSLKGAGYVWRDGLVAPNLTPDKETGIGTWTDDMLIRAIREGISHDGRVLDDQMWSMWYRSMSDEDVEAVVAYLRSLKPIRNPLPKTKLTAEEVRELEPLDPVTLPVLPRPPTTDPIQRGRRLANLAGCVACHTSWYTPTNPGQFGGGNPVKRGDVTTLAANITIDASGIAHYDAAFFREVIRTGKAKSRELSPVMPWIVFRNLSDDDLDALFAYLRAVPKVKHVIDNIDKPTKCAICGGEHPLGQYNKPHEVKLVSMPLAELKDMTGTYRFESGFQLDIAIERGKFMQKFSKTEGCELTTEDRRIYYCHGDIEPIEFVRDASGKVTGLLGNMAPAVKIR